MWEREQKQERKNKIKYNDMGLILMPDRRKFTCCSCTRKVSIVWRAVVSVKNKICTDYTLIKTNKMVKGTNVYFFKEKALAG